jgi:hypothetical protein
MATAVLVAPTEWLRSNFTVVPNLEASGDPAAAGPLTEDEASERRQRSVVRGHYCFTTLPSNDPKAPNFLLERLHPQTSLSAHENSGFLSSSVVERSAVNRLVVGSNPTSGAILG